MDVTDAIRRMLTVDVQILDFCQVPTRKTETKNINIDQDSCP